MHIAAALLDQDLELLLPPSVLCSCLINEGCQIIDWLLYAGPGKFDIVIIFLFENEIIYTLHILSALPFESGPLVSLLLHENHHCQNKFGCSYVGLFIDDQHSICVSRICHCDERTCINVHKWPVENWLVYKKNLHSEDALVASGNSSKAHENVL